MCPRVGLFLGAIDVAALRITTTITMLDYYVPSNSLHAAHSVGYKERGTNVIAANVRRHAPRRD